MHPIALTRMKSLLLLLACLVPFAAAAAGPEPLGSEEVVFDWSEEGCETWDIPDAPARAWADASGRVRLIAGAERSRASAGKDLGALERDCAVLHEGAEADGPGSWNDRTWVAAVRDLGGGRMLALGHMEYHGHLRPDECPGGRYIACWYNAIVELRSYDGGRSFRRHGDGRDLVAALPYRFDPAAGRRLGYFNPSNILERDGFLYAFVFAEAWGAQRRGACLLRRPVGGEPADWRAWDGAGFTVRFVDPYAGPVPDPARHSCTPVRGLSSTVSTVVRHAPSGRFVAVTPMVGRDGTAGIWWSASDDLTRWTAPRLLVARPLLWARDCSAPAAYAYPSLLDAEEGGAAFDTISGEAWLYLTRIALEGDCKATPDRDLVRIRIRWPDELPR